MIASPLVRVGSVVADKFRVERVLAEGGMGVVVAATHLQLDRVVALKFLRADISSNWDALARFTREARAAAQLKSEHVAHVLDVGVTDDGTPYMVMEYLEGLSLYRLIQTQGVLDISSAAEYAIQACEGLAEAHSRGIVHRDIKPDNLFLVERSPGWRTIKILDFGISKFALADAHNIATGVIMGSPCYMSPEQLRSTATVDHRTDIWSLGASLHEFLTGKAAFDASLTLPELVAAILHKPAPPLRELRPDVPEGLAVVVDRCLAKDRDARFDTAAEVAKALLKFAPDRARPLAERAASMIPAFSISKQEVDPTEGAGRIPAPMAATQSEVHRVDSGLIGTEPGGGSNGGSRTALETPTPLAMSGATGFPHRLRRSLGPKRMAIAAWGLGALLIVALAASLGRNRPPAQAPAVLTPTPSEARPLAGPTEMIDLVVRVSPLSAQITIDGAPVPGNPFHARYPKDEAIHQIRGTASGFEPKWEDVPLAHDMIVDMSLDRRMTGPVSRTGGPAPPATRAAVPATRTIAPATAARQTKRASVQSAPVAPYVSVEAPAPTFTEVTPGGGRVPLRPIETKNPYESP
jgi:serine/threonine-protein kinase